MTIQAAPSEQSYSTDGVSTVFAIPFPFDTAADIKITSTDASGNILTLSTGFTISGGAGSTGNATFSVAPVTGLTITIYDDPARTQPTDYVSLDAFPAESHERALDRVTRIAKRLYQLVQRSVRFPDGDVSTDGVLGSVANRKGKYLFFNAVTGAIEYAVAIVGQALSQSIIGQLLFPQTNAEALAGVVPTNPGYSSAPHDVRRYGAVMNGIADDSAAWASLALVMGKGGSGYAPPLPTKIVTGVTLVAPAYQKVSLIAYGCTIKTTGAICPFKITGGFMGGLYWRGGTIDNTNDFLQLYGIDIFGAQNVVIEDVWGRVPDGNASSATWALVRMEPSDPTNNNTGAFWNQVVRCATRQSSGNAAFYAPFAVQLLGACNACTVRDCHFGSVVDSIGVTSQTGGSNTGVLANALLVTGCAFEGGTNAVHVDAISNANAGGHIEGLRIIGNRFESLTGSALLLSNMNADSATPPVLSGNYYVSSTANYVTQSGGAVTVTVNSSDPSITPSWGVGSINSTLYTNGFWWFKSASNADDALKVGPSNTGSGIGLYTGATRIGSWRYRPGGGAYIDSVNGWDARNLQGLSGSSTQAKNLRGTATFAAATTVAVAFGTAEADASYFVALGGNVAGFCWVTAKATTGFTINCSASNSNATDWHLIR